MPGPNPFLHCGPAPAISAWRGRRSAQAGGCSRGAPQTITRNWNTWDAVTSAWRSPVLIGNGCSYDANSNRLTNTIGNSAGPIRTESYGYDSFSRSTSFYCGDGQTSRYSFDPIGSRLTKTDSASGSDTYTYNAANMLLSRNGGAYTNDANGNTLRGGNRKKVGIAGVVERIAIIALANILNAGHLEHLGTGSH